MDTTNDCTQVASVTSRTVYSCTRLTVDIAAADISTGTHVVTVTNPDPVGCSSTDTTSLVALAPPTVGAVAETIACNETADTNLTITGTGFAVTGAGDLPTVTIGGQAVTTTAANDCTTVTGTNIQTCTELTVTAAAGTLSTGSQAVVVANPGGAGCQSSGSTNLQVYGTAEVTSVSPSLFCDSAGGTDLTLDGNNFLVVDTTQPTVTLGNNTYTATVDTASCTSATTGGHTVDTCTKLTINVPQGDLPTGTYQASVTNPAPVDCPSSTTVPVVEAGAPTITDAQPSLVCSNDTSFQSSGTVTLTGTNFLLIDGNYPTVTVNGVAATVNGTTGCAPVSNPTHTVDSCTTLTVTVPSSERAKDMHFSLNNPAPADCGQPSTYDLPITPAPVVTAVTPLRICNAGGSFQIDGQNFDPNMTVTLAGVPASDVTVNAAGTSATVTFGSGLPQGQQTLTVINPSTCHSDYSQPVRVVTGPQVFYVDPPVTYNGINTQVTIYLSGLYGGVVKHVDLVDSQGNATALDFTFNTNKPNTVQATIPANILPQGTTDADYDIRVTDDVNCAGTGKGLLHVTDQLTVAVNSITPPFGWTNSSTAVHITATDPAPSGQVQFMSTPRVYLNPVNAGATTLATELKSVQFIDATDLNAIVPSGLPVGQYDLIVVNPDGTVGLLTTPNDPTLGAFQVTQDPPPLIDSVTPGSWPNDQSALSVTVTGDHFRQPNVQVFCTTGTAGTYDSPNSITVNSSTTTSIDLSIDTTNLAGLSSCYMEVTDTDNGTYADYSPITITNPAGNFVSFKPGTTLSTARRDPAMSSGVPSRTAKFIYAIGGDDGTDNGAFKSMEMSQVDRFGAPGAWTPMPTPYNLNVPQNELPAGLTHADSVRIGDFIYLVGGYQTRTDAQGNTTGAASAKVLRANVLDPLNVPDINNVELVYGGEQFRGNDPGVYYYRVSAVLDSSSPDNPGGETLPSEPQPINVPFNRLKVHLSWPAFPHAVSYRVYRTATPNQSVGTEELLAEVPAPAGGVQVDFVDDGTQTITSGAKPLPLGSLGTWHQPTDNAGNPLALQQARYHHGVTSAPDPDTPGQYFVYAAGGTTDGTDALGDYEYFAVTINGPRDQTVSPMTDDTSNVLSIARKRMPAVAATPENSDYTDSYVYVLGGMQAGGTTTRTNEAAIVNADGSLGAWTTVKRNQIDRADYAGAIANNNVVVANGASGSANASAHSTVLCNGTNGCTAPDLVNWNSLSNVNLRSRAMPGYVSFNGFLYIAGGYDYSVGANAILDTTDYSVLGGTP